MVATPQFWVGVVFTALLVAFLWGAFKHTGPLARLQYIIIQFVCALCAGTAGAFFTGAALFEMEYASQGARLAFQGTAGVALFALTLVLFSKLVSADTIDATTLPPPAPPPAPTKPQVVIAPGTTTTFHQVAETLAEQAGATIDLSQLTKAERSQIPRSEDLLCGTLDEAKWSLVRLANLVAPSSIRPYSVDLQGSHFTLHVQG